MSAGIVVAALGVGFALGWVLAIATGRRQDGPP